MPGACLAKDELTAMIDREHKVSLGVVYSPSESLSVSASFCIFFGSIARWDRRSNYSS